MLSQYLKSDTTSSSQTFKVLVKNSIEFSLSSAFEHFAKPNKYALTAKSGAFGKKSLIKTLSTAVLFED